MSKKNAGLLWLIPIKIIFDIAFSLLGIWIDVKVLFNNPEPQGHGIPVFTVIFPCLAVFTTFIMIIVIVIILLVRADRQIRSEDFAGRSDTNGRQQNH